MMEWFRTLMRLLAAWTLAFATLGATLGLALLLASTDGLTGYGVVVLTVLFAVMLAVASSRWGPKLGERAFAIGATMVGAFAGSIALAIFMAALTSSEWQMHARALPRASWSLFSFAAVALVLLPIGLPALKRQVREGTTFGGPEHSTRAPILPGNSPRDKIYRTR